MNGPVVGFDLDMTLVDSRPGIGAVYAEVSARTGVPIDVEVVVSRLGPPLEVEMAHWVEPDRVEELCDLYRSLYPTYAIAPTRALPGAHDALAAVRETGGRTLLITAKNGPHARLHVDHLGLDVDAVHGLAWREGKARVLREHRVRVYVGDHVHDVEAARGAGALAYAVTTGPCDADALRDADVVAPDLRGFAAWLTSSRPANPLVAGPRGLVG